MQTRIVLSYSFSDDTKRKQVLKLIAEHPINQEISFQLY